MNTLYGIKNCDTVKKARKWLEAQNIDYTFHDFRADGLSQAQAQTWFDELGEALINKRSTTWKQLSPAEQAQATQAPAALLVQHPTLIKRPLLDTGSERRVGFKADEYAQLLG
ncbi:ArsC family reductase [Simiduia aestuariiviva]|uniref:Spx/MgsR family transcriptional regulator n=1 Tax=Simiduia aestuariiviva TaxID=1510459 RepID=A0A839UM39_9GAMM|nr:ArsC family reductase [Simiduia aestuariiviva]MBB3167841.1 Spx/MgsR family transcriptional regulator [Simiduia aestuariiviva]